MIEIYSIKREVVREKMTFPASFSAHERHAFTCAPNTKGAKNYPQRSIKGTAVARGGRQHRYTATPPTGAAPGLVASAGTMGAAFWGGSEKWPPLYVPLMPLTPNHRGQGHKGGNAMHGFLVVGARRTTAVSRCVWGGKGVESE